MSGFADPFLGLGSVNSPAMHKQHSSIIQPSRAQTIMKNPGPLAIDEILGEEEEEIVDLNYIITERPKAKIVREFMKYNLSLIKSEEDMLFDPIEI